jgi:NAD(P)-dependent dehydrogenase (short-subunit alcohol dehydrogenase family)
MVGRYFLKPFLEATWDDFLEKFNDEIKAAYEVTRAVLPDMVNQNYGRIIYVATGAKYPNPPGAIAQYGNKIKFDRKLCHDRSMTNATRTCVQQLRSLNSDEPSLMSPLQLDYVFPV